MDPGYLSDSGPHPNISHPRALTRSHSATNPPSVIRVFGSNRKELNEASLEAVLDICSDTANKREYTTIEYIKLDDKLGWRFPEMEILHPREQMRQRGEIPEIETLCHSANSNASYIDICHDLNIVHNWILLLYKELKIDRVQYQELHTLIQNIRTSSGSFSPQKGHTELNKIIKKVMDNLRKNNFSIIEFTEPYFMPIEDLDSFFEKLRSDEGLNSLFGRQKVKVFNECGRKFKEETIEKHKIEIVLGTAIQAIDAGSSQVEWREGEKWGCEMYGGVKYRIKTLASKGKDKNLLIISYHRIGDNKNGGGDYFCQVFHSKGAISVNEVIRLVQTKIRNNDFDGGVRGAGGDCEEGNIGSNNVTIIHAGTIESDIETNLDDMTPEGIFEHIATLFVREINLKKDFEYPQELLNPQYLYRIYAGLFGLKTIGDRSSTNIIERLFSINQQHIHVFVTTDEFLVGILQTLYLTGKIPYLPTILVQKPGGYLVYRMSNSGIKELKKRFYRMKEFNAMTPEAKTQLLRKENGLDILELYVTRNKTVEKPTTAWEKVEVLLLESINEDCKKQSEALIRQHIELDIELQKILASILASQSEDINQQIVQCLSKISQAKPNPSVGIAQVQVEGSPFGDENPNTPDIRKSFTENNQEQLLLNLEDFRTTLFQTIFKGYKGKKVIKINAAMNNLFNRSLHNGQLTDSLTSHISIAHYIDKPELRSSNQDFYIHVTIARNSYGNGMDYLMAQSDVQDYLFHSDSDLPLAPFFPKLTEYLHATVPDKELTSKECTSVLYLLSQIYREKKVLTAESQPAKKLKSSNKIDGKEIYSIFDNIVEILNRKNIEITIDDNHVSFKVKHRAGANAQAKENYGKELKTEIEKSFFKENDVSISEDGIWLTLPSSIELLLDILTKFENVLSHISKNEIRNQILKRLENLHAYQVMTPRKQRECHLHLGVANLKEQVRNAASQVRNAASNIGSSFTRPLTTAERPFSSASSTAWSLFRKGGRKTHRIHKRITSKKNKHPAIKTRSRTQNLRKIHSYTKKIKEYGSISQ